MSTSVISKIPARSEIRAWCNANGYPQGSRGKFNSAGIAAWNARHPKRPYIVQGGKTLTEAFRPTVKVTVKPDKGRAVTRTIHVADVRAAARAAGQNVGKRGILSESLIRAYVLGTL